MSTRPSQKCERCGREVEPGSLWTLGLALPSAPRAERSICIHCAAEVQRFLLTPPAAPSAEQPEPEPDRASRAGWFLVRATVYVGIAAAAFVLVTWLTSL